MKDLRQIETGPAFEALMLLSLAQEAQETGDQTTLRSLTQDVLAWEAAFFYTDHDMVRLIAESSVATLCASSSQQDIQAGLSFACQLIAGPIDDVDFKRDLVIQYADEWIDGLSSPYEQYVALRQVVRPVLGQPSYRNALSFVRRRLDSLRPAYKAGVERRAERPQYVLQKRKEKPAGPRSNGFS